MAIYFDDTEELVNHLRQEKIQGKRFATRYILVQGCQAWDDLIPKLALEVDKVVSLSDFCTALIFSQYGTVKVSAGRK